MIQLELARLVHFGQVLERGGLQDELLGDVFVIVVVQLHLEDDVVKAHLGCQRVLEIRDVGDGGRLDDELLGDVFVIVLLFEDVDDSHLQRWLVHQPDPEVRRFRRRGAILVGKIQDLHLTRLAQDIRAGHERGRGLGALFHGAERRIVGQLQIRTPLLHRVHPGIVTVSLKRIC